MNEVSFIFKKMTWNDIADLKVMYKLCLGREVDDQYFKWKYFDNPAGEAIGFVAYSGNQIAGFYGVIPENFKIDKNTVRVFQSMDTMTHPDFQKRGLFTSLATMTYDYLKKEFGTIFLYGVAGPSSLAGFIHKLNWKLTDHIPYIFLHKSIFAGRSLFANRNKASIQKALINSLTPNESYATISPVLSREFLKWRLNGQHASSYEVFSVTENETQKMIGWCVLSTEDKMRGKIEYLSVSPEWKDGHTTALIAFLFKNYGFSFIYTWRPGSLELLKIYRKQGFLSNPFESGLFSYKVPFITYSNSDSLNGFDWFDKENFDIQPLIQD